MRTRARLRTATGTRCVPHHRWRQELGAGAVRRRKHRLLRARHGSNQPTQALRGHVADRHQDVDSRKRRSRKRAVHVERWRHDLDPLARAGAAHARGRQGQGRDCAVERRSRLRHDRNRRWSSVERQGNRSRPGVAIRGRRAHLARGQLRPQRHGPRALLLTHLRRARQRERNLFPDRQLQRVSRRGSDADPADRRSRAWRRSSRHVDRSDRSQPHDHRSRPGLLDL